MKQAGIDYETGRHRLSNKQAKTRRPASTD